jgi:hypothetical protein
LHLGAERDFKRLEASGKGGRFRVSGLEALVRMFSTILPRVMSFVGMQVPAHQEGRKALP